MIKRINITLEDDVHEKGKRLAKKLTGKRNFSAYVSQLIMEKKEK